MSHAIEFIDVEKAYPGKDGLHVQAVTGINFRIEAGEFFCLLGPSGCGKTTLLNMLAGFEMPTAGQILVDNEPITAPGADRGVVFQQDDCLLPWLNTMNNIAFGLKIRGISKTERRAIAQKYMEFVGLSGQGDKFPRQLSGGMRQRVQLARVLANDPEVLAMDEPFGALDAQTRRRLQDELTTISVQSQNTVLFITHDIVESVLLADRVGVMSSSPGSILEIISIDVPRPRDRLDPKVFEYVRVLTRLIDNADPSIAGPSGS